MAVKKNLIFRRDRSQNMLFIVDWLIGKYRKMLRNPEIKGSVGDLIRLIRLARQLDSPEILPAKVQWID